ncbi:type VII secretion-associated protein [Gordonia rubripertincta]|uniref:Type VII secretion-associated protein n=1 Tax=Gordonia rubripertincta TaxID=36822 RepID=A0ABT4N0B1_GORRU|nr:type VII secretion-associated protein [Gordonia rubripertincta]MCZ4552720.1 type VII secretion-associated protein [Gordonia rubripertincta]
MNAPSMRAAVADVAYDHLEVGGRPRQQVGALVASINASTVVVDGERLHSVQAWRQLFDRALAGIDDVTVAHPSTWGTPRTSLLRHAATVVGREVELVPRAVVIARSHLDATAQRALVIEVAGRIDIHEVRRAGGDWQIASTTVATDQTYAELVAELADNGVEAILVDGAEPGSVESVRSRVEHETVVGRVACVRRALVQRYGGATAAPAPITNVGPPPSAGGSRRRPLLVAAVLIAVVAFAVAVAVVIVRDGPQPQAPVVDRQAQVGRVSLAVPGDWRQSSEPAAEGVVSRTTFAAPQDDRRIIVLQNAVRSTSTLSSVAGSLRNRIDQRGDDVVQEFSASTRYAGREVISYREVPVSGGAIRWYLVVAAGLQVSVGCQAGSAGDSIDEQCIMAVGSVRIGDR